MAGSTPVLDTTVRHNGRPVIVSAASRGIGRALSGVLTEADATVAILFGMVRDLADSLLKELRFLNHDRSHIGQTDIHPPGGLTGMAASPTMRWSRT